MKWRCKTDLSGILNQQAIQTKARLGAKHCLRLYKLHVHSNEILRSYCRPPIEAEQFLAEIKEGVREDAKRETG